jgi:RHS repeat-associated protein
VRDNQAGMETQWVKYTYDVMNRRIAKSVDSDGAGSTTATTTRFVYDGDNVLLEFDGSTSSIPSTRYLHGPGVDQVLAQDSGSNTVWHLADHLGTIHDLVDSSGAVVNHYVYDSFGNVVDSTSGATVDTRYKFTGREFDGETGMHYYRARYYDAKVGRFIGQDPLSFNGDGPNLYTYVLNHPVDRVDPYGEKLRSRRAESFRRTITYQARDGQEKTVLHIDDVIRARRARRFSYIKSDVTFARIVGTDGRGSGSGVSDDARARVPDLRAGLDDAGHIIGRQLGGSGKNHNNLFSQERNHNRGWAGTYQKWREYENKIAGITSTPVGRRGCPCYLEADMTVKLWYERPLSSGAPRPASLRPINITSFTVFKQPIDIGSEFNPWRIGAFSLGTISAQVPNPKRYP